MNTSRQPWCVVLDRGGSDGGEAAREVEGFAFREDNAQPEAIWAETVVRSCEVE
jgi:hypothetical protein